MALQHTRLISKVFQSRLTVVSHFTNVHSRRHQSESSSSGGAPYRPYPGTKYTYAESADYWTKNGFPSQSAESDEYDKEELYLHEIEERLKTYDKKYCDSDRIKALYNEFGWDAIDDRATINYGGAIEGTQYGPGKKLDPSHYVTPEWTNVNRKAIPPIQYMTAEQIRRSRGSYASVREMPPEQPSVWKFWNAYSCLGAFGAIMISKEFFVTGGHDMFEAILMWSIFGTIASVAGDWFAWWHTLVSQESYDREYFPLLAAVRKYNDTLERFNSKPNEKRIIFQLQKYRESLAEKVLDKTLQNKLGRIVETTMKKLNDKIGEEQSVKKEAENVWKRTSLQQTIEYFEDDSVREDFMNNAISQFCSGDTAKLSNETKTMTLDTDIFMSQYKTNYENAKQTYLREKRDDGALNWVFVDENEREQRYKSASEKESDYDSKIQEWSSDHNPVNAPTPSFT